MRVCVLTTSYPRTSEDVAGLFVAEGVDHLRAAGLEVTVVSPADFRHFGIAYGDGIVQNLRAKPWLAALLPAFLVSFALAARREARGVDVVHAHWLVSGLAALATRKRFVLQVWGTDVELAARAAWLVRPAAPPRPAWSSPPRPISPTPRARSERGTSAVMANGIEIPASVEPPDSPPHVLFVGRLSPEKGILEFLEATEGLARVVVGDGPLRGRAPESVGFIPHDLLGGYYERAAIVCVPSRREGYGVTAREAMAYGRPVVATEVGGLVDAVTPEETGLLVPSGDLAALRAALERLLADPALRERLGAAARVQAQQRFSWHEFTAAASALYAEVAGQS